MQFKLLTERYTFSATQFQGLLAGDTSTLYTEVSYMVRAFVVKIKEKFYLVLTEGNILLHIPLQSRKRYCHCLFYWGQAVELPARSL